MVSYTFRAINISDIANATGLNATQVSLVTELDGRVTVEVPNLTATQSAALKAVFTARGLIEDNVAS